jgi:dienelactone hydrolase
MPLGVFTFNFRFCESEDGCQAYLPAEWLLDAQAALEAAVQLEGVDPEKVIAAGASNGGDGAVDACAWMNTTDRGICLGAFALSPSSSLTIDFRTAATTLLSQETPAVVYCLYGLLDDAAEETCDNFPEIRAVSYGYVEAHGLELILVDRRPDPLQILQDFINDALGVEQ